MVAEMFNIFFTTIFTLEAIVKILGYRKYYFKDPWNIFDFTLVIVSILDIILSDLLKIPISATFLRVVRVFRIGRVLRMVKVNLFA